MIKNLRHVGLVVSDMDRAIKFYQKLGLKIISKNEEHWGPKWIKVCKMTHGLELIEGVWVWHVAFEVDSMEDWRMCDLYARKDGVKFIKDPDGNVIELVKEDDL